MAWTYDYPRPMVSADVAVLDLSSTEGGARVLLIRRGHPPFQGSWALPGGFLEMDEDLPDCAARELREETGLGVIARELRFVGVYGKPGRDPRGRVITVVYAWEIDENSRARVKAGDDAAEAAWFPLANPPAMAFDHAGILEDLRKKKKW